MTNHYATLNLHKGASEAEIKAAYKKLAMKWHPDRNKGYEKASSKKFVEIRRAHDILLGLEEDSGSGRSSTQTKPSGSPFDPFDKAGSPPREHSRHSSSQRRRGERRDTNANNYNDFAYEEPKRRGRANTVYTSYPDASEGRYDTYNGRSRSNTQHDHFRKHEKPSHTHRQRASSYYEEPSHEYREPRNSSHHRARAERTSPRHEPHTYEYREPRDSSRYERRDPRETSYGRRSPPRTSSYYESDSRYEEPSYTPRRDPSYYDREQSYEYCEPKDRTYYDYDYNDRRTSPSVHDYSSDDDSSSYSRRQHETSSCSPPHIRVRLSSVSPSRYEYEKPTSFDFRDLRDSLFESVDDFHRDAMRDHDRVHDRAMRDAGRPTRRDRVTSFLRTFVT